MSLYRYASLILMFKFSVHSGVATRNFMGHQKDVMSVALTADNRQIVSGSRDGTIKLWNTLGVSTIQVCCSLCYTF